MSVNLPTIGPQGQQLVNSALIPGVGLSTPPTQGPPIAQVFNLAVTEAKQQLGLYVIKLS